MRLEALIASVFRIPESEITDELAYQSISEWDSLRHVELLLAIENAYCLVIERTLSAQLATVASIRAFIRAQQSAPPPVDVVGAAISPAVPFERIVRSKKRSRRSGGDL
jgi:acyl carrier protein